MSEGTGKGKVVEFPGGEDSFAWRTEDGLLHRFATGRYAIVRTHEGEGPYDTTYIVPDLGHWEDTVLMVDGQIKEEVRQINSANDYKALRDKCDELNRAAGFAR
ncbi:MAG TPA: hypothetical protein VJI73_02455 [Candidatus Paceibacterota bacterium]